MQLFTKLSRGAHGGKPNQRTLVLPGEAIRDRRCWVAAQRSIMRKGSGAGSSPVQIGSLMSTP
jgi:hypothetical protein